jgi:hypothetical protein
MAGLLRIMSKHHKQQLLRRHLLRRQLRFFFHRWHRRTGIAASFLVILLSLTGVALNHTGSLGLAQSFPQSSLILWPYQAVIPKTVEVDLPFGRLFVRDQSLMRDEVSLATCSRIVDFASNGQETIVACESLWYLLNNIGELLETVEPETLGLNGDENVQLAGADFVVMTDSGWQVFDTESLELNELDSLAFTKKSIIDPSLMVVSSKNTVISWQRVILDLHSGRWFGDYGVWLMDAAAVALILLALSGLWIWLSRRRPKRS